LVECCDKCAALPGGDLFVSSPSDPGKLRRLRYPGFIRHRVIILGGGFGGLYAARALCPAPVDITLIDRRNYHLFQPLLYQMATGSLSPAKAS